MNRYTPAQIRRTMLREELRTEDAALTALDIRDNTARRIRAYRSATRAWKRRAEDRVQDYMRAL